MNEQLIKFIELCLIDGIITDKEREVIFRKSKELGVPEDECEIILGGMVQKYLVSNKVTNPELITVKNKKIETTKTIPLKKAQKVDKAIFGKKSDLEQEIKSYIKRIEDNNKTKKYLLELNTEQKKRFELNIVNLKKNVLNTLNILKKGNSISLGRRKFQADEIILKSSIQNYLELHGSLQWGPSDSVFNPQYPHPISVLYNHVRLGFEIEDQGKILSGYMNMSGTSFKYFTSEPSKIFDLNSEPPNKVLVYSKAEKSKDVILLFDNHLKLLELNYSFKLKSINYKKDWMGIYEMVWGNKHTYINVMHEEIDLFKGLIL